MAGSLSRLNTPSPSSLAVGGETARWLAVAHGQEAKDEARKLLGHKAGRGCMSGDTTGLGQKDDGQIDKQMRTGHCSPRNRLG